jgi:hypothetical protein
VSKVSKVIVFLCLIAVAAFVARLHIPGFVDGH